MGDREPKFTRRKILLAGLGGLGLGLFVDQVTHLPSQPTKTKSSPNPTPSPSATAGENKAPTEKPTPTSRSEMKPASEKDFPGARVFNHEKFDMATPENFNQYFQRVTPEQFSELLKTQPDLVTFPFNPKDNNFSIGELTRTADGTRYISIYCQNVEVYSSQTGKLAFTGPHEIDILRLQDGVGYLTEYDALGDKPNIRQLQQASTEISEGLHIFDFLGSGSVVGGDSSQYSAKSNQLAVGISKAESPSEANNYTLGRAVDLTPSLNDWQKWVHTETGKIAVISNT